MSNLATIDLFASNAKNKKDLKKYCANTTIKTLNASQLERISSYLTLKEISNFSLTNKKINKTFSLAQFTPLWTIHSFLNFYSKTGYTGVKN